ncbi:MAG TPA: hypothetical protein VF017_04065 [Thermoanaerobaculia bacterium]|nr:hypothetical protein [Thermoanaerobaculia bacterium]
MTTAESQRCTFEQAWGGIAASVVAIRPLADRLIPAGAQVVAQPVPGESPAHHQGRLLAAARRNLLTGPGLALGLAFRVVREVVERDQGRTRSASVELGEALRLSGLALAQLGEARAGRRLLLEARWLLAFGDPGPEQRAEVMVAPLRLLAARGQLLRAAGLARAMGQRLEWGSGQVDALAFYLQASLVAQALGQSASALAAAVQASRLAQPELDLAPALRHTVIAWGATTALNTGQPGVVEDLREILAAEGEVHPAAAPFRLWLNARVAIDRGEDAFAHQALAEVVRHFEERGAGVEHRLASLDLASLLASFGSRQEALALAARVMAELAGIPSEEERRAALERSIGESPFAQALLRRDLAPPGGVS